jgi:hypothetical protein
LRGLRRVQNRPGTVPNPAPDCQRRISRSRRPNRPNASILGEVVKCGAPALTGERGLLKGVNPGKVPEAKVAALPHGAFVSVSAREPVLRGGVFPARFGLHLARQKIVHQALAGHPAPAGRRISSSTRRAARWVTGVHVARRRGSRRGRRRRARASIRGRRKSES